MDELPRAQAALRFVAEVSSTLAESLDYQATIRRAVRLAIPFLADWCTIDLLDEAGVMRRIAAGHRDPEVEELLLEVRRRQTEWASPLITQQVVSVRQSMLVPEMDEAKLEQYVTNPEIRELVRRLGNYSGMMVPMLVRGRAIGAMTFVSSQPERRFGNEDLALAEDFARRAAAAIDNAHLYEKAQRAIRARDEFLTVASHELNTPLASLLMLADGLNEGPHSPLSTSPEALAKSMRILSRQVRRMASLVGELLDVARVQSGSLRLELEEVDLVAVARDVLRRMTDDLGRAGCKVTVTAPERLYGHWDRARLGDVLRHLLSNAMRFGPRRPIEIEIEALPEARARLVVQDHGIGILPERLPHVFQLFERAVSPDNYGGLGLGLFIVGEVVRALGGSVQVTSALEVGSRFTVELPRA